ncbi:DUF47 domain-containing protein [Acetobacterium bakii]|uniref:PhoU family transcriptional regulator n=1 Tax=Acetobacterium bakii TaxID=52689 RepID=A0A0L6U2A6_9FIRM|nr:DUF47 family protein [Acetobacterium bakii]KNZ41915.1 PhoU family transcriptional regulator [Acetobacterium bakii]
MERNIIDRIFPVKYRFYELLSEQARCNYLGVTALYDWVRSRSKAKEDELVQYVKKADTVRMKMEDDLTEAFSTPFDRGDIYSISVGMNRVLKYAESTLLSMEAFEVISNEIIIKMLKNLKNGVEIFLEAVDQLKSNPDASEDTVVKMRNIHIEIEKLYRDGMITLFAGKDPMVALKMREVYHHIKDASSNLEETVDVLHRIIVRLI